MSPVLANLFLHYAFDVWVRREMPKIPFCRYADDGLLHCISKEQAEYVLGKVKQRFLECSLEIHPDKSGIIYCKDKNRKFEFERISFDFLGYTFRSRRCVDKQGLVHPNFLPAISRESKKEIIREIRSWHIHLRSDKSIAEISNSFGPVLKGWFNYYGRFYPTGMNCIWYHFNWYIMRWVQGKYKRFAKHKTRAFKYVNSLATENPRMFIHWQRGVY